MTWDEETHDGGIGDPWAARTATTLKLTERISMLLFVGAALALVLGVASAIGSYNASGSELSEVGNVFLSQSAGSTFAVVQAMSFVAGSLLPAGLLASAAVALRLQAARFEADVLDA